jgi:hypothetical protein
MAATPPLQRIKDGLLSRLLYNGSATRCDFATSLRDLDREVAEKRRAYRIRPVQEKERSGIDVSRKLLSALHKQTSTVQSFELWYDGVTSFVFTVDAVDADKFETFAHMFFPEADVEELDASLPPVEDGEYVASARLSLKNDYFLQILNPSGPTELRHDPYNEIVEAMNGTPEGTRVAIQVAFRRAPEEWWACHRRSLGDWSDDGPTCEQLTEELTGPDTDDWTKTILRGQENDQAFVTDIRLFAFSDDEGHAADAAVSIARTFAQSYDDPKMNQGLRASVAPSFLVRRELERFVRRDVKSRAELLGRQKRRPTILTLPELSAVVHVPSRLSYEVFKLTAPNVDWKDEPTAENDQEQ